MPSVVVQRRCPLPLPLSVDNHENGSDSSESRDSGIGEGEDEREGNVQSNVTKCKYFGMSEEGDSDIWVSEGKKGSRWRDSLVDSALERIWKNDS